MHLETAMGQCVRERHFVFFYDLGLLTKKIIIPVAKEAKESNLK